MSGCKIGKIRMKNGGAEIRIHPCVNDSTIKVSYSWGEIVFRMYDGEEILPRDALYMLRAAENEILRGNYK